MHARRLFALFVALAVAPCLPARAQGGDWAAYRDAYRAMVAFEKYGGPKSLLQQQLQVLPRHPVADAAGVQLMVVGKASQGNFPLDATLRTVFPLARAAYDENATLQLTRPLGPFTVRAQVSLLLRPDNLYDSEALRRGCDQALAYARQLALFGARKCVGVGFVFGKGSAAAPVMVAGAPLASAQSVPFAGDGDAGFPVVTYRFAGADRVQLVTASMPLAITPLFD